MFSGTAHFHIIPTRNGFIMLSSTAANTHQRSTKQGKLIINLQSL